MVFTAHISLDLNDIIINKSIPKTNINNCTGLRQREMVNQAVSSKCKGEGAVVSFQISLIQLQ